MKKRMVLAFFATSLTAGVSFAADWPVIGTQLYPSGPRMAVEWTGIYFGVNAGYGWAQGSSNTVFGGGAANTALLIPAGATSHLDSVRQSSAVRACLAQAVRAAALLEVKWVSIGKPEWSSSEPSLTLSGQDSRTLSHSFVRRLCRAVPPLKPSRLDRLQRDGLVSGWRLTG